MKRVFILIVIFWSGIALGQDYVFEHFSTNDGLSNNLIRDIAQDQEGYLWFATSGGLNRFDGHSFDIYKTVIGDTLSLSDSRLSNIFLDHNGFIWTRSSLGNVHRIDPQKHQVVNFQEMHILPEGTLVVSQHIAPNGDIWLILNVGLLRVRYNSRESKDYTTQYFDQSNILPDNTVNFVFDDSRANIWIGTQKGLVRFEPSAESIDFTTERFFAENETAFISVGEFNQKMYFGTGSRDLFVFDYNDVAQFEKHKVSKELRGNVTCIQTSGKNQMLLGTSVGDVVSISPFNDVFHYYKTSDNIDLNAEFISEIVVDSYGIFWLVAEKRGVYQFNADQQKLTYFDLKANNRMFLGEPDKQIILEDSNRDLWIGINGGGLFLFNRASNNFTQFSHDPSHSGSLSSDIVLSIYEDRSKNLWIGTSYGGVNKISLKKEQMRRISPVQNPKTGFDNYIRSITTDVLGNVWVGSKAGKIYVYRGVKKIGTIPDDLYRSGSFPETNVYCLFFDNDHNLWIGSKGNGIYVIKSLLNNINNLHNPNIDVVHFMADGADDNSLISNDVYSIKQDVYGQYWIGMLNGGLNLLIDPFGKPVFQQFVNGNGSPNGIVSTEVRDLFFDNQQNLWIATSEGVSILENRYLKTDHKQFINLSSSITDPKSMSGKVVYQIKQAKNHDIFLAMLDGGINQLKAEDFKDRNFRWQHQNSQILSPNVYSMEEDNEGNIWIGTDNGLFRLNASDGVVEKYRIKSSLLPLTFSENCSNKTLKQELVFGSNNGFIIFHPDSIKKDTTQFPLKFSKMEINGENIANFNSSILKKTIQAQSEIELNYSQNNISLYFSVLDFVEPDAIQYSYFLEGYDTYWSKPSINNSVSYRKLPPGEYLLQVKATNSSGTWIKEPARLLIIIHPPFWRSTAGYILVILIVFSLVTTATIILYRQIIFQNKIRIEKTITEKRFEYYTNISHEFKTPLSLILNPVEEIILSHKSSDFAKEKGMQIKRNATYLKRLIEQILDFRKIREGRMQLQVTEVNLVEFFREIYLVFLPLAQKMGILFEYEYNLDSAHGYIDIRQLEKVVYNLLSNSFRFTPKGKPVYLKIEIDQLNEVLKIEVSDEGVGIDETELAKIFERFYNSKNSSGIGLFYTREIVNLHKGEISAKNNAKEGATLTVNLPIGKNSYSDVEILVNANSQLAFDLNSIDDIEVIVAHQPAYEKIHKHMVEYLETILIVEDNPDMRKYLSSELSAKYKIIEASNGEMGVELARKHLPALILSDVIMPGMDGYKMTKMLKDDFDTSHIPIILITAESSDENKLLGVESGADDYILKPFLLSYLLTKVEQTILQRKKLKERYVRDSSEKEVSPEGVHRLEAGFMEHIQQLVIDNLSNQNLNVDFLVDEMKISRTLFFKKMKAASGYAPNEYLRMVKMKEAARMIKSSDKSMGEISAAVGFSDSNYFGKTFKKHFGFSPSEYKSNRSKNQYL
ncbi:MAG: two-component regulator propeller domain-containing protein [Prolixibacteraceae bacterium]